MRVSRSIFFLWICFTIGQGQLSQKAQKIRKGRDFFEEDLALNDLTSPPRSGSGTTEDPFFSDFGSNFGRC